MDADVNKMTTLRWLVDEPTDGPTNMGRDEALLQCVGSGDSPPTLRFYRWKPPTISLGYFQEYAEFAALPPPAGNLAVVRRQTGGGAILHDLELTYALVLPAGHPLIGHNPTGLYAHVHNVVARLLREHGVPVTSGPPCSSSCSHGGPFFCFERHSSLDLLAGGEKLMGSAQRRTATAILQHGSLVLDSRFPQQRCATVAQFSKLRIDEHLEQLAAEIASGPLERGAGLQPGELALAAEIRAKYADDAWTRKR